MADNISLGRILDIQLVALMAAAAEYDGMSTAVNLMPALAAAAVLRPTTDSPGWREMRRLSPQGLLHFSQPLEAGETVIARANHRIVYPSRIQLIAAMNPCRCGRAGEPGYACRQGRNCADRYQARVSGPLLDRIDMQIEVPTVTAADLILPPAAEGSREIAARVARARDMQAERYAALCMSDVRTNAQAQGAALEEIARPDASGLTLLRDAADTMRLSARGYHRVLRVARTLADLDGAEHIGRVHLAEALSYRALADEVRRAA